MRPEGRGEMAILSLLEQEIGDFCWLFHLSKAFGVID